MSSINCRGASATLFAFAVLAVSASPALAGEKESSADDLAVQDATTSNDEDSVEIAIGRMIAPIDSSSASYQDGESEFTVSGEATLATDYRFRGVSQTDKEAAIQGGLTIAHSSGFYVGTWASNLSGWGTFGGSNMELDLIAGVELPVGEGTLDAGIVWYMYPGGADTTDFAELYASLSGTVGPLELTAGVAYAPSQEALGNVFPDAPTSLEGDPVNPGDKEDNLYLSADAGLGISGTPITLSAHIGYSDGNPGVGPNGTTIAPTGTYFDRSLGAEVTPIEGLTISVAYIDTDITAAESAFLQPSFSVGNDGTGDIADATVVASITASF